MLDHIKPLAIDKKIIILIDISDKERGKKMRNIIKEMKRYTMQAVREELIAGQVHEWDVLGVYQVRYITKTNYLSVGEFHNSQWYEVQKLQPMRVIEELAKRRIRDCFSDSIKSKVTALYYS